MEEKLHSLTEKELQAWLRFIRDPRWSRKNKSILVQCYGQPEIIYDNLSQPDICQAMSNNKLDKHWQQHLVSDLNWLNRCSRHQLMVRGMPDYPPQLEQLSDPPMALFCCGDAVLASDAQIAMVGSRRPTPLGRKLAVDIARQLSEAGVCVSSGLAAGIDSLAHQGALQGTGGTLAVLGCGIDTIYPKSSSKLYRQIAENHCLLSEYPPGTPPLRRHFPERNRLVAGLSLGTVVIEAAQKSGTMITARLAMESNKEVMVVPGSACSPVYQGSHRLIQQGAALVLNAQDILHCLSGQLKYALSSMPEPKARVTVDNDHTRLLDCLHYGADSMIDEIIQSSGLTPAEVSSMLLTLELSGKIAVNIDGSYTRI